MLTTVNHVLITFHTALCWSKGYSNNYWCITELAKNYFKANISCLLLPKALELYGTTQQTHFIQNPYNKEISGVTFETGPKNLPDIKFKFDEISERDMSECILNGTVCKDIFWQRNPEWFKTFYSTHLYQDKAFTDWLKYRVVYCSQSSNDKYTYRLTGKTVERETLEEDIELINAIITQRVIERTYKKFDILIDEKWFEEYVYACLCKNYSKEMLEYTWKDIQLPSTKIESFPDFVSEEELLYGIEKTENDSWMV